MSVHSWVGQRELGLKRNHNTLKRRLWKSLYKTQEHNSNVGYNGIFGLKYSPDGRSLVAACEKDAVVVIDPLTSSIVNKRERVHTKRCNTITFIDDRLFATCSDDANVSVWDLRNLHDEVLQLNGHRGWVKNVEFHKQTQCLVSASFDDQVIAWDINKPLPNGSCEARRLLKCADLMRMRISPDGNSMYMSSMQTADLIAIHNLDVNSLETDIGEILCSGQYGNHTISFNDYQLKVDRMDKYDKQSKPFQRRNNLELYYGYDENIDASCAVFCQSIDVHPKNMAIALRYDRFSSSISKFTSIHNTWSYYNGPLQGANTWSCNEYKSERYLPLPRGLPTNYAREHGNENVEYIQEVTFSPCGRLLSSPFGYGIRVMAFDEKLSDYQSHIASRTSQLHQWDEDTDKVLPAYADIDSQPFHDVTYCFGHRSMVLSTCFSPVHMQIASGSKDGQIILYDVVL